MAEVLYGVRGPDPRNTVVRTESREEAVEMLLPGDCGRTRRGYGTVDGKPVCHTDEPGYPDCYRLVTVHGHELGSLRAASEETENRDG